MTRTTSPIIISLIVLTLAGCTYHDRKQEYKEFQSDYYQHQLELAQDHQKPSIKEDHTKFTDKVKALLEKGDQTREKFKGMDRFSQLYDFTSKPSRQWQKKISSANLDQLLSRSVSRDLVLNVAYLRNPGLAEARRNLLATVEGYSQAAFLEGMVTAYQGFVGQIRLAVGMNSHRQKVENLYPYPDTLALKGEILDVQVEGARQKYLATLRNLVVDVSQAYYHLVYVQQAEEITRSHQKLLQAIHQVALKQYESDRAHHSTVLRIQVELSKISDVLITLEQQEKTALADLNRLMSRSGERPMGRLDSKDLAGLSTSLAKWIERGLKDRQEVKIARARWQEMEYMVQMTRRKFHPSMAPGHSLLGGTLPTFAGPDKKGFDMGQIRPMPQFWFSKREAYLRELEQREKAMAKMFQKVQDQTRYKIKKTYYQWDRARREVTLYKNSLIPRARQAYQVARRGYESGKVDFANLIDVERVLLEFELKYHRAVMMRNFQILELMKVVGG